MITNTDWENKLLSNVKKNITWLLEKSYGGSQTSMAKDLAIKINTLNTYINTETKPPLTFLWKLCIKNNLSLDSLVNDDLELSEEKLKKKELLQKLYNKYRKTYYAYFLVIDSNSLKEGLVQEGYLSIDETGIINLEILNSNKQFSGKLTISDELSYFDLKNNKEKFNIMIKSPGKNIKEKYVGGIGITNISSPEDTRIPCAQKIILSSVKIPIDKYFGILQEFLTINTYLKIKKNLLGNLLINDLKISSDKYIKLKDLLENNRVSGEDKITISGKQLTLLQETLDKDEYSRLNHFINSHINTKDIVPFNSLKVNIDDDKMFYRFIKNEFNTLFL